MKIPESWSREHEELGTINDQGEFVLMISNVNCPIKSGEYGIKTRFFYMRTADKGTPWNNGVYTAELPSTD